MLMEYSNEGETLNEFEDDADSKEQLGSFFPKFNKTQELLNGMINLCNFNLEKEPEPATDITLLFGQLKTIISPYQEQPYLLDPYLENLISPVIEKIRETIKDIYSAENEKKIQYLEKEQNINYLFKFLYFLSSVRGYKTILKFFSHEVSDLEPTIQYLILHIENYNYSCWETKYVLLIWLSLIFMIPFDIKNVDSGNSTEMSLFEKIMKVSKEQIGSAGKEQEGAALLISRILLRKDIYQVHLQEFINWSIEQLKNTENIFLRKGILTTLCTIYKLGLRDYLLPLARDTLPIIHLFEDEKYDNNPLLKKLLIKLTQRLGLCFLKPKIATWRYKRGNRSLNQNIEENVKKSMGEEEEKIDQNKEKDTEMDEEESEDEDIPECIEEVIEILLIGLKDKATIVRWSSAKGIGRLTQRLPKELAEDVIECVINLFSENTFIDEFTPETINQLDISTVSDGTWHGTCLALAELAKRGLLLPNRLSMVIPWTIKALTFDQQKGSFSVGSNVRDAACYVCWSFARAYEPKVMKNYIGDMARTLVSLSLFDRELNIRRASSAAFQENVGRQGLFPHGIDIITKADYFAVGNRNECYRTISCEIAEWEEYRYSMIEHLLTYSVVHWDQVIRELAAQSLGLICKKDILYTEEHVIPRLVKLSTSPELNERHGALVAIGEICKQCYYDVSQNSSEWWTEKQMETIINPISGILMKYSDLYLTSFGSEIALQGICHFILELSKIKWPKDKTNRWEELLLLSLERKEILIQNMAVEGIKYYYKEYPIQQNTIDIFISKLSFKMDPIIRSGYSRALGVLPYNVLKDHNSIIFNALVNASYYQENENNNDVDARKYAIIGLTDFSQTVDIDLSKEQFYQVMDVLFDGIKDYSIDNRGDIGSLVREQCMKSFECILTLGIKNNFIEDKQLYIKVLSELLQQSVEKINRIRVVAGSTLITLLWKGNPTIPEDCIAGNELLQKAFLSEKIDYKYIASNDLYDNLIPLLVIPEYRYNLLIGLIVSVGGITESLVRDSSTSLLKFISELPKDGMTIDDLASVILNIFNENLTDDRIIIPLLMVFDLLLSSNSFKSLQNEDFFDKVFENIKKVVFKSRNIKKLVPAIKTLCGILSYSISDKLKHDILQRLLSYLIHPFPRIRKLTAEQLYMALININNNSEEIEFNDDDDGSDDFEFDDEEDENIENAKTVLLETNWNLSISQLKPIRNSLYEYLEIKPPVFIKNTAA